MFGRSFRKFFARKVNTIRNNWNRSNQRSRLGIETLEVREVMASNFVPGNVAILLTGNSTNATGSILEFNPSTANQANPVQTLAIDSTSSSALRFSSAGSFGLLNDTSSQTLLAFGGANSNSTSIADITSVTQRGVGSFDSTGNYALQTTFISTVGAGDQVRAATSVNDANWYIGDKNGLYTNNSIAASIATNIRQIKAFAGTVYVGEASAAIPISTVSSPTATTLTSLPGNPKDANLLDFTLVSSGQNGPAYDVMYITTGTIIDKYSLIGSTNGVGGTWTAEGSASFSASGIAASGDGSGGAYLYLSTGTGGKAANNLVRLDDTSAWNANIAINTATTGTNPQVVLYGLGSDTTHSIRGVAFAPLAATSLTEQVSSHSVSPGNAVTLTANVSSPNAGGAINSGVVYFIDSPTGSITGAGSTVLNAASITNGVATFNTSSLSLGIHKILAYYPGTTTIADALTPTQVVSVTGTTASSLGITSVVPSPGTVGVTVNLTVTVTGAGSNPTGSVEFFDNGTSLGIATLTGTSTDTATLPISTLSLGTHSNITAIYYGDATFQSSTAAAVSETINAGATLSAVSSTNPTTTPGGTTVYSATVTGNGLSGLPNGSPTGTVTFYQYDYGTGLKTAIGAPVTLVGSGNVYTATTTPQTVGTGSFLITATYNGNTNYASVNSPITPLIETGKQAFTIGNLIALDRQNQPSNASQVVALLEYTPSGTFVQAEALPVADVGSTHIFGLSGHAATEGALALSGNESLLTAFGFDLTIGTPSATSSDQAVIPRTVGQVDRAATTSTTTAVVVADHSALGNVRGAVTLDGNEYWVVGDDVPGSGDGLRYIASAGATTSVPVGPIGGTNGYGIELLGVPQGYANIYVSTQQSGAGQSPINLLGTHYNGPSNGANTALPITQNGLTPLPGLLGVNGYQAALGYANNPAPYGFLLFNHLTGTSVDPDTLYVADQTFGLLKFANVTETNGDPTTGSWDLQGQKLNNNTSVEGLAGYEEFNVDSSFKDFQLFATAAVSNGNPSNQLLSFTDTRAYNNGILGGLFNVIANAVNATDTFSGLSFAPLNTTTTTLATSVNPAPLSLAITFTATVIDTTSGPAPTGTVTFTIDGVAQAPSTIVSGVATYTTPAASWLGLGNHTITASYNGDASNGLSTSAPLTETVNNTFAPGDIIALRAGDGTAYNSQAPLFLDEYTQSGILVETISIPNNQAVGGLGNQPITIDLAAAAGNGQLNRSYDGSVLSFGGIDSGINNGIYGNGATVNITAASIVTANSLSISSISEANVAVTVTTSAAHGFVASQLVNISGFTGTASGYNGNWIVTPVAGQPTKFTFTAIQGNLPAVNATGTAASSTVTVTTDSPHGFLAGQTVTVAGATPTGYNTTSPILTVPNGTTFTYSVPTTGLAADSAGTATVAATGTPTGSANRVLAVVTNNPAAANFVNTTTYGPFYVGDDNRAAIAESATGPIYAAGHPNSNGNPVSGGVQYFATEGIAPLPLNQVSSPIGTNIRGLTIGFDNRMYWAAAKNGTELAGVWTETAALPTSQQPVGDIPVVISPDTAGKLGGIWLADMNGNGVVDDGDRLYFIDDGTVLGTGTGGLYVSTWNSVVTTNSWNSSTNHWSGAVRIGDVPAQLGSGGTGQLRGITGTVLNSGEALVYVNDMDNAGGDNSHIWTFDDTGKGVQVVSAAATGNSVTLTFASASNFTVGQLISVSGVGTTTGGGALQLSNNGQFTVTAVSNAGPFTVTYTDNNASLFSGTTTGGADLGFNPTTSIVTLNGGSVSIVHSGVLQNFEAQGIRGVAFAPVASTSIGLVATNVNQGAGTVTLTATLANTQVTPTGSVSFIDRNTNTVVGTSPIVNGVATLNATFHSQDSIVAYYGGGGVYALAAATSTPVTVNLAGATTSTNVVLSTNNPASVGLPVTISATVTGGSGTPTGTVSFYNGAVAPANLITSAPLNGSGVAQVATSFQATTTINAVYNGNATYAITSGSLLETIAPNAVASIVPSANNVLPGTATVTYTATLTGNATLGAPTGTVKFFVDGAATGAFATAVNLTPSGNNASATSLAGPALTAGSHIVTIQFIPANGSPYAGFTLNTNSSNNGNFLIENAVKAFTPGNLVAVRRGDGSQILGGSGTLTFVDEYNPSTGALVQSIALPNVSGTAGQNQTLVTSGYAGQEGMLARSGNNAYITLAGINIPVGTSFITSTLASTYHRTIARLGLDGIVNSTTSVSGGTTGAVPNEPSGVVSLDGNEFWIISDLANGDNNDSGINYVASLGATTLTQVGPNGTTGQAAGIFGGQLYVSTRTSNAGGVVGIAQVGTGLPTTLQSSFNSLPGFQSVYDNAMSALQGTGALLAAPYQFLMLNTNDGTSNNPNLIYVADQNFGLLKFYFNPGNSTWNYGRPDMSFGQKTVFAGGTFGLTGNVINPGANAQVQLYVTGNNNAPTSSANNTASSTPNQIDRFLDTNAGTIGSAAGLDRGFPIGNFTVVAFVGTSGSSGTPNGNENFSGLAFAPGAVTNTAIVSSAATTSVGNNVTFTATLTSTIAAGVDDAPTGFINFLDGATVLATVPLSTVGGLRKASFTTTTPLALGNHTITAQYTPSGASQVYEQTSSGSMTEAITYTPGTLIVDRVGTGTTVSITAATGNGTVGTITTSSAHGLSVGQQVVLAGVQGIGYNGTQTVDTVLSPTQFTFQVSNVGVGVAKLSGVTESGTTVTATTSASHGYQVGESVVIAGATVAGYNGTFTITGVLTPSTFTYTAASGLGVTSVSTTATATVAAPFVAAPSLAAATVVTASEGTGTNSNIVTVNTAAAHGFYTGQIVTVAGVGAGYNGTVTIANVLTSTSFTYLVGTSGLAAANSGSVTGTTASTATIGGLGGFATATFLDNYATNGTLVTANTVALPTTASTVNIASASQTSGIVTITTASAHGFTVGQQVTIADVNAAGFNGVFTIASVTPTTFTYSAAQSYTGNNGAGANNPSPGVLKLSSLSETATGTVVTATTAASHGYVVGESVVIAGATVAGYNGMFTITGVPSATTFTYTAAAGLGTTTLGAVATTTVAAPAGGSATVVTNALTEGGTFTTEGYLSSALDGHSVSFTGYAQAPGFTTGSTSGSLANGPTDVIGVLSPTGSVDTSTKISAFDTGIPAFSPSVRGAVSADGLGFYVATGNFVRYVPFGNVNAGSIGISAASYSTSTGLITFTTAINNNFTVGQRVAVGGVLNGAFNNSNSILNDRTYSVVSASGNTFTVQPTSSATAAALAMASSGGYVNPITSVQLSNFYSNPNEVVISPAGQFYADAGTQFQSNGIPSIDGPAALGTGLTTTGAQGGLPLNNLPIAADQFNNFPTSAQFAFSPDGNTLYIADSRVDSNFSSSASSGGGGILKYTQSTPGNWSFQYGIQLNTFAIASASENGNTVLITTTTPHGFTVGQSVAIDIPGTANTGYRGNAFTVTGVTSPTTFTLQSSSTSLPNASGGFATASDGGARALAVDFSVPATPVLYVTTSGSSNNRIVQVTDSGSSFTNATTVATAPIGEAFRGLSFAPTATGTTASSVSLSVNPASSTYGNGPTLTATVTGANAKGVVSFRNSVTGLEIGAAPLVSGVATLNVVGNLPAGTYTIIAVYTGDTTFASAQSTGQSVTITQATPSTTVTSSLTPVNGVNAVTQSTPFTLTAAINVTPTASYQGAGNYNYSNGLLPTGNVTFTDTATGGLTLVAPINQVIVNVGGIPTITFVASITTSLSTFGDHVYNVTYSGDANFTSGSPTTFTVSVVNSTVTAVVSNHQNDATATPSTSITYTATVTSAAAGTLTGTVQFYDNLVALGNPVNVSGPNTGAIATLSGITTALTQGNNVLTPGLHSISAVFTSTASGYGPSTGVDEQPVAAKAFNAADEFVARVGDGITPLIAPNGSPFASTGSIGNAIYLDEYTPAGVLVQSIALPTADGTGSQNTIHAIVSDGQTSADAQLTLSGDGGYLFVTGYDSNPLNIAVAPLLHLNTSTPRAVARIDSTGNIQTIAFTAGSSGVATGGNIAGVYSPNGTSFYVSGGGGNVGGTTGVWYSSTFTPLSTLQPLTLISTTSFTPIGLESNGGNLAVAGFPYTGATLVGQFAGQPTTAGATVAALPGLPSTDNFQQSPIDVYFAHLDNAGHTAPAGVNTMYLSDSGPSFFNGKITKWALVSGSWTLVDTIAANTGNTAPSFGWLSGSTDGSGNVTLLAAYGQGGNSIDTVGGGSLYSITDSNGYNDKIGTAPGVHSDAATLVSSVGATSHEVFRGVARVPTVSGVAPTITSANNTTFVVGTAGTTFTVTATGTAPITFTETGALPTGVTLSSTGIFSGTPAAGTGGSYSLVITASNGTLPNATQNFTLTVNQAPAITSANATTFTVGTAGSFTVTTAAGTNPTATFTESGALPTGVTLSSAGILSGTPAAGTGGVYPITITANNGVNPNATQTFTLTVNQAPSISSSNATTFTVGTAGSFTVTTAAGTNPTATFTETGALPTGVTLSSAGILSGTPAAATGGTYNFVFTASNGVAPNATQNFTLTVNQAPAITSANTTTFTEGTAGTFTVTATGFPTVTFTETGALPGGVTLSAAGLLSGTPAAGSAGNYPITITGSNGVNPAATQSFTLIVNAAGFNVVGTPTVNPSDLVINLNQSFPTAQLNLFSKDETGAVIGTPDLTLVGNTVGNVRGSLIVGPGNQLTFVKTGSGANGLLAPDTYTLTLRSATDGFVSNSSQLLNGGTNYTYTFTVASSTAAVLSLPDFARGAGQVDASGNPYFAGLPVNLSNGAGVTSLSTQLVYDPTLLTLTGATTATGFSVVFNPNFATLSNGLKVASLSLSGGTALGSGAVEMARLQYAVPGTAAYKNKEVLHLQNVSLNGGAIAVQGDDAVHAAVYLGDVDGSGTVTAFDASKILNESVLTASQNPGFAAYRLLDPVIVGNVIQSGSVGAFDASKVLTRAVGTFVPEVPAVPAGQTPPAGGPDPRLFFSNISAQPGQTVTVAVNMQVTEAGGLNFQSLDLPLTYDATKLTPSNIRLGSLDAGYLIASNTSIPGQISVGLATTNNQLPFGTIGSVVLIDFTVAGNVPIGTTTYLDIAHDVGGNPVAVNGGNAVLNPAPTNSKTDANVDAVLTVTGPQAQLFFPSVINASSGATITVPVNLKALTAFSYQSLDLAVTYDMNKLQLGNVVLGSLNPGFLFAFNSSTPGRVQIGLASTGQNLTAGQTGDTVDITFQVLGSTSTYVDIAMSAGGNPTAINGGNVTLVPAPTNATNDPNVDGVINIVLTPNQPPHNSVPASEGQVLFNPAVATGLRTATANTLALGGISVTDSDAGTGLETTTITVTGSGGSPAAVGTLAVTASGAATVGSPVIGSGTYSVAVTGNLTDLNATLASLVYTPGAGFYGNVALTVSTNDNGNTGFGGPLTDVRSSSIQVVGMFISEVMLNRASNTTLSPNQYLEVFSTVGTYTIPSNVYLVGIEGDNATAANAANNPGLVQDIFKLGGFQTGTNGYLAFLEKAQQYGNNGNFDVNGTELVNAGTGNGFGNGGTTSSFNGVTNVHNGQAAGAAARLGAGATELVTDIELGSETFLLIQAPAAPTTAVDIDASNAGTPGGTTYNTWNVLDGVGILDNVNGTSGPDRSYAPITFKDSRSTGANAGTAFGNSVATTNFTATYVGRIGKNTGQSSADWLASVPTGGSGSLVLGPNSTQFAGQALNHVGGPNYWAPQATVVVNDGGSAQHSQVSELTVNFSEAVDIADPSAFVVKDAQGNALSINVLIGGVPFTTGSGTQTGVTSVVITFNADATHTTTFGTADPFGNTVGLNDGNFFLNINGTQVSSNGVGLDGAKNGSQGTSQVDEFFRLFGDTDGNRVVDGADTGVFRNANNSTNGVDPNYLWFLDFNQDGNIDVGNTIDRDAFRARLFQPLNA